MRTTDTVNLNQSPELIALRFNHRQMTALRQIPRKTRYVRPDEVPEAVWQSVLDKSKPSFRLPDLNRPPGLNRRTTPRTMFDRAFRSDLEQDRIREEVGVVMGGLSSSQRQCRCRCLLVPDLNLPCSLKAFQLLNDFFQILPEFCQRGSILALHIDDERSGLASGLQKCRVLSLLGDSLMKGRACDVPDNSSL